MTLQLFSQVASAKI